MSTSTVTTYNDLPQNIKDYGNQSLDLASQLASRPFPDYTGQRVADFSPDTLKSFDLTRGSVGSWMPSLAQATGMTSGVLGGGFNPTPYLNPNTSFLADEINRQGGIQRKSIGQAASNAGAFNSARHGVVEGEQLRGQNAALGQLSASAWDNAIKSMFADQTMKLGAAGQLANLGFADQSGVLKDAAALQATGATQQGQAQAGLDTRYQDFLRSIDWGPQGLNLRLAAQQGTPYESTKITTGPGANTTAQNLGALAALTGGVGLLGGTQGLTGAVKGVGDLLGSTSGGGILGGLSSAYDWAKGLFS